MCISQTKLMQASDCRIQVKATFFKRFLKNLKGKIRKQLATRIPMNLQKQATKISMIEECISGLLDSKDFLKQFLLT